LAALKRLIIDYEEKLDFLLTILYSIKNSKSLQTDAQIKAFVNSELIKYFGEYY